MKRKRASLLMVAMAISLTLHGTGCALLVAGAAGGAAGAVVSTKESEHEEHAPMTYVATVLTNVVYVPAKVVFAVLGAVTSGVTYLVTLGSSEPTDSIWNSSVRGNYVVTPRMIEGKQTIHFAGA